jgi:hypothetical protein
MVQQWYSNGTYKGRGWLVADISTAMVQQWYSNGTAMVQFAATQ